MNQQPATSNQQPVPSLATGGLPAVQQCRTCLRYFMDGELVALSFGSAAAQELAGRIGHDYECGRPECAGIAQQRKEKERLELHRFSKPSSKRDRREGKKICHSSLVTRYSSPDESRKPYKDDDESAARLSTLNSELSTELPAARPLTQAVVVPNLLNPGARQAEFIASGATSETDARVRDFLLAEQNFGKWFSRRLLKEVARNDLLNNIADRLRDELRPQGFDVDNCMMSEAELGAKSSHYRICRVADSLRLSDERESREKGQATF